ncbi:hypothetical protein [Anaeromyxobacter oryzae]|uniref:hypothetical protein n=1 Tax=Anaeromyxobacter oryzae TaxID=2918170 RepID=UPI0020BF2366|nr:hypothetical protein [Anaeromyxobacter oryzae]
MRKTIGIAPVLVAALAACDSVPANAVTRCDSAVKMGAARTDILFVIDDSGSMSQEQQALKDSLYAFIAGLAGTGIQNDFQIGVTTTSVTDFDEQQAEYPASGPFASLSYRVPYPAGRLVAVDPAALTDPALAGKLLFGPPPAEFVGPRILPATSPTLQDDFKANVLVGILGSGKEQPFRAARRALEATGPGAPNEGFLRAGARLAIVFLSDEDDCSESAPPYDATTNDLCHAAATKANLLDPVSDLVSFLDGPIAGEARQPIVAVIAGYDRSTLAPTGCATSFDLPTRYTELLDALGPGRTIRASICEPMFDAALSSIANLLVPQTVPLEGAPPDWHMLVATVTKAGGEVVSCPVAAAGTPEAAAAGAVYTPPLEGGTATVTFQGACTLHRADQADLRLVCAG